MGLFIVFEGLDGSGGETQSKLLGEFLRKSGKECEIITYPDYEGPIGRMIHDFLHKKFEFPHEVQFSLFATDMVKDKEKIADAINKNKVIVADRYFTSTISYEILKGFPLENGLKFAEIFGLPKPDLVIFLDISSDTSMKRKSKEKNILDRHEADKEFLEKVRGGYLNLINNKVFAKEWAVIDGEKPIEEVAADIQKIVLEKLK